MGMTGESRGVCGCGFKWKGFNSLIKHVKDNPTIDHTARCKELHE